MSSRCRSCKGLLPALKPLYPQPAVLAALAPFTRSLMDAAAEYESVSEGELTTATDFVRWLDQDAQRAAAQHQVQHYGPAR